MSMMSCLTIFSGSSARSTMSFTLALRSVETRSKMPMCSAETSQAGAAAFACHCNAYDGPRGSRLEPAPPPPQSGQQPGRAPVTRRPRPAYQLQRTLPMALDNPRSQVAHLLRRAGFGTTEAELDQYTSLGFAAALE